MAEVGRVYRDAAPSQWSGPQAARRARLPGAHKTPGRTRERTHYELTDRGREALADWVRTPATLPRIQNEPVVRLLAADLVDPAAVLEGLEAMRTDLNDAIAGVEAGEERAAGLTHRAHLLEVNHRYAQSSKTNWARRAPSPVNVGLLRRRPTSTCCRGARGGAPPRPPPGLDSRQRRLEVGAHRLQPLEHRGGGRRGRRRARRITGSFWIRGRVAGVRTHSASASRPRSVSM